jgi:hypothetical protein
MKPLIEQSQAARMALQDNVLAGGTNLRALAMELGKAEGDLALANAQIQGEVLALLTPEQRQQFEDLKSKAKQYKNMNDDQLLSQMQRLMQNKQVRDKVKQQDTDKIAEAISPVLNDEQKKRLAKLAQWLKQQ